MQQYIIDNKSHGQILFRYIKKVLPGLKNSEIFKLIRKKIITVNNKKTISKYKLNINDIISIYLKDEHLNKKVKKDKFQAINTKLNIIYEDKNLLVVNKQRGILTHPDNNNYKVNLYESVRSYLFKKGEYDPKETFTPAPCHRLDRNTSGIIVIAKNHDTLQLITNKFRERKTIKRYLALVYGKIIKNFLITSNINSTDNMVSVSELKILTKIPNKEDFLMNNPDISATLIFPDKNTSKYSLINVELWTGKKHQIRAHLAASSNPLLGDKKYFNDRSNDISEKLKIKKYYLHSYQLKIDGFEQWEAEIPDDFKNKINELFGEK